MINTVSKLLLVVALLGWTPNVVAGTPDWLRAIAREHLPKYSDDTDAVTLLSEQVTSVNDDGEIKTVHRRAYKILRPQGRERGLVTVYFDNETRLTNLKGWSITAQGTEYEVKEKDAVETSIFSGALYQDTRHKLLKIPAAEPGNVIGYEYEQRGRPSILQDTWWFQDQIPVRRARFTLRLSKGWEFETFWLNRSAREAHSAGENQWAWELEDIPAIEDELSMPPWRAVAGRLAVSYYPGRAELSGRQLASWSAVGGWYARLAEGRRQTSPEIRQKVAELTSAASTTLDKIRTLAAFVQRDIRYVAIEIGIGGYQPHPAAEVFSNRYGDCKDKATLLSVMLREIGVDSYYVLINSRRRVVAEKFPSALNFNHAIVAMRLPKDDGSTTNLHCVGNHKLLGSLLFFDPTDPLTPLGYLPSSLQANYGLLVKDDGGELVALPLLSPSTNRLMRTAKLELTATGTLSGRVQEIRWGSSAASSRAQLIATPDLDRRKVQEKFLGEFLSRFTLGGFQVDNLENLDKHLVLNYGFVAENYAKPAGNLLLVRPRVLGQKSTDLLEQKERKYPIEFPTTSLETDTFEIALPSGYTVDELPAPVEANCDFASYKSQVEVTGNLLRYSRNYTVKDVWVPTERLAELKKFYRQIADDERSSVVLKRSAP